MGFIWYTEDLEYLNNVIKALNEFGKNAQSGSVYIAVELREQDTHEPVGRFTDEIAPDCWAFEETWGKNATV